MFELSPQGGRWIETVLYSFTGGADGAEPQNGLIMDSAGNLYGTTDYDLNGDLGTVFELNRSGRGWTEQVIYDEGPTGYWKISGPTMDAAGNIFGTTYSTVFELSPNGIGGWNPSVIHTFTGGPKDGLGAMGTLVLDQAGNVYGTTILGGSDGCGTVFKLSPRKQGKKKGEWTERILHSFKGGKDGEWPHAGIVFDAAGNIYGTAVGAGGGRIYELEAQVGKHWYKEKVLWGFNGTDGSDPEGSLILDSAGNLYGTTWTGGSTTNGVVYQVTP